jgi:hypothetical protein
MAGLVKLFESQNGQRQIELNKELLSQGSGKQKLLKGLILAQNERWRRGLGMQVGGIPAMGEPA